MDSIGSLRKKKSARWAQQPDISWDEITPLIGVKYPQAPISLGYLYGGPIIPFLTIVGVYLMGQYGDITTTNFATTLSIDINVDVNNLEAIFADTPSTFN